jgi:hypothetical protein
MDIDRCGCGESVVSKGNGDEEIIDERQLGVVGPLSGDFARDGRNG